ncbi:MAG: hypothetical protein R3A79_07960 [Nannocystaceae bacterium]
MRLTTRAGALARRRSARRFVNRRAEVAADLLDTAAASEAVGNSVATRAKTRKK